MLTCCVLGEQARHLEYPQGEKCIVSEILQLSVCSEVPHACEVIVMFNAHIATF